MEDDLFVLGGPILQRFRSPQLVPPMDEIHLGSELGKVRRFLDGRVTAAHHGDFLTAEKEPIAGGAGADAATTHGKFLILADAQPLGRSACCDDDGICRVFGLVGFQGERTSQQIHFEHSFALDDGAETQHLLAHLFHEIGAHDAISKAGVVLHFGGDRELTARLDAFEHHRRKIRSRSVKGRRVARGAGANNDDFVVGHDHSLDGLWALGCGPWA